MKTATKYTARRKGGQKWRSVMLPMALIERVQKEAKARNISVQAIVRECVEAKYA